jgi:tetratricopeptide (TPR) repeat protein
MGMHIKELEHPFDEGKRELTSGRPKSALIHFTKAAAMDNSPLVRSYIAYCKALTVGVYAEVVGICMEAMRDEPKNSEIYLNLGRIHLLAYNRKQAIKVFQLGLRQQRNSRISTELTALGVRKQPPFPFLHRSNPINKYLGIALNKLCLR